MNEAVVNSMSIINGLNKVDGFDPSAFLRRLTGENGEEQVYLDVKYRTLVSTDAPGREDYKAYYKAGE